MRYFLILILSSLPFLCNSSGWKMHPIFDEEVTHVVETPGYVYFTSKNMADNEWNEVFLSLFRYDKKGEEVVSLSTDNLLNGNSVRDVIYNPAKGYLAVLYKDYNMDFIHNDGKVTNMPYYRQNGSGLDKRVNSMNIDVEGDRLYLATGFGYVAINDKKFEIAETGVYDFPLQSFCRWGNYYLAIRDNILYKAPVGAKRISPEDFVEVNSFPGTLKIFPVSDNNIVLVSGEKGNYTFSRLINEGDEIKTEQLFSGSVFNIDYNSVGLNISTSSGVFLMNREGDLKFVDKPSGYENASASTTNMADVWMAEKRKGLGLLRYSGEKWNMKKDFMLPNAPSPFASVSYANHPDKGLLVLNYGYNPQTLGLCESIPFELSSYKNGKWNNHSPAYTNPSRTNIMMLTNGMVIDPDYPNYVYITSCHNGIVRLNLDNSSDIIHLSRSNDPDAGKAGFETLVQASEYLPIFANFSAPYFDSHGNMWMNYADWDDRESPNPHLYCWTREDRLATITSGQIKLPQLVEIDTEVPVSNTAFVVPLLKTGKGLLVHVASRYDEYLVVVDTKDTPLDTSDDKVYRFTEYTDTDGNSIEVRNIRYLWEDPTTGYVWICHLNGVCYFDPGAVTDGKYELHRVKVSRNDGTSLADYLLDGVTVNQLTTDASGRKWFATAGGGVVCTTSDGREIISEFNTDNSPLPDNVVYGIGYNSKDNSLILSTAQGFAEYFLPADGGNVKKDIKAYPNPVRPDFSGYVTITDIPEGSLVKITDASGNLVKELGPMSGFEILWDISDTSYHRVSSGVYYILVSPGTEAGNYSAVGKILVIN